MRKMIEKQLCHRNEDVLELWGHNRNIIEIQNKASIIISDEVGWPNTNFIPEDNFLLLLGLIPGDETEGAEIVARIFKACGLRFIEDFPYKILTDELTSFGDFIYAINDFVTEGNLPD